MGMYTTPLRPAAGVRFDGPDATLPLGTPSGVLGLKSRGFSRSEGVVVRTQRLDRSNWLFIPWVQGNRGGERLNDLRPKRLNSHVICGAGKEGVAVCHLEPLYVGETVGTGAGSPPGNCW